MCSVPADRQRNLAHWCVFWGGNGQPIIIIPIAPLKVDVDNEVTLNWNPPVHPNEQLTGYTIYVSPDPSLPLEQWRV